MSTSNIRPSRLHDPDSWLEYQKLLTAAKAFLCLKRGFTNDAPGQNDVLIVREANRYIEKILPSITVHEEKSSLADVLKSFKDMKNADEHELERVTVAPEKI